MYDSVAQVVVFVTNGRGYRDALARRNISRCSSFVQCVYSVFTASSLPSRNTAASYLRSESSILHAMLPPQPQTANHLLVGHAFAAVLIGDHDDQRNPGSNSGEQLG